MFKTLFSALIFGLAIGSAAAQATPKMVVRPIVYETRTAKKFAVRASYFSQLANAERLAKTLRAKGHDNVEIVQSASSTGQTVGFSLVLKHFDGKNYFSTKEQAERYLVNLKKKHAKEPELKSLFENAQIIGI